MALELIQGGDDDDALVGVIVVPGQRGEARLCIDCGQNPTMEAHKGEPLSGYTARCDACSRHRDNRILAKSRPCSCGDGTVHAHRGPFCRDREESS